MPDDGVRDELIANHADLDEDILDEELEMEVDDERMAEGPAVAPP
jgi:hypothetical protein